MQDKKCVLATVAAWAALTALRAADLALWCNADTGFAVAGPAWARLAAWGLGVLVPCALGGRAAAQPAALAQPCPLLGGGMAAAGALLVVSAAFGTGPLAFGGLAAWADVLLPLPAGVWLLRYGVQAFGGMSVGRAKRQGLGGALPAAAVPLYFLWRLLQEFQTEPAALWRLPETLHLVGAAAALVFASLLLKPFLAPGLPCGHTLFRAGGACFVLCAGPEAVQTAFEAVRGTLTVSALCGALACAVLGVCGLAAALLCAGPEAE